MAASTTLAAALVLGNGLGSMAADPTAVSVFVGLAPTDLATVDLDGDGRLELVAANLSDGSITALDPADQPPAAETLASSLAPVAIDFGDVDGDGLTDLVVADAGAPALELRLGLAGGGFGVPVVVPLASDPGDIAVADFDGDGDDEIAVSELDTGLVKFYGSAALTLLASVDVGGRPFRLASGDLVGDARPEVVVADAAGGDLVIIGPGGELDRLTGATIPFDVVVGDIDRDAGLEIVVADVATDSVLLWDGVDDPAPSVLYSSAGSFPARLAIAQLRGSPTLDIAVSLRSVGEVVILDGRRPQAKPMSLAVGGCPSAITTLDVRPRATIAVADLCGTDVMILR